MKTKHAALAGVLSGCLTLALGRGEAPAWLRCLLVAGFMALALLYGFRAFTPYDPRWLSSMPVVGSLCIIAGSLVLWVPSNAVLSTGMIGFGCRCILLAHRNEEAQQEPATGTGLARYRGGELDRRTTGTAVEVRDDD